MAAQDWPPRLDNGAQAAVLQLACDWALANGLVLRPPTASSPPAAAAAAAAAGTGTGAAYAAPGQSVIHAPYALYPSAFPRNLFEQAVRLQPAYNRLYADVTVDDRFLEQVIGGAVSKVDEFQGRLYEIWKQVKQEGIRQVCLFPRPPAPMAPSAGLPTSSTDSGVPCGSLTAPRPGTVPVRLPRARTRRSAARRPFDQAGRIQHHLGFVRSALDSRW